MMQAPQHRRRLVWQPIWLGVLLCLFLVAPATAEAHGTAEAEVAFAAAQPVVASVPSAAADHESCPGGATHGQQRRCASQGVCHVVALVHDAMVGADAPQLSLAPRAATDHTGSDVAPLFHPPRSSRS
jgi:hypothetical protein